MGAAEASPPGLHPDDLPRARQMAHELSSGKRISDTLRLRSLTGTWIPVHIEANLMLLDEHTTAAYTSSSPPQSSHAPSHPRCADPSGDAEMRTL